MGSSRTSSSRKKSKQSRKVKKELRRLKRKIDKKERFGLFSGKIAWTLAFCFNGALGAAVPEDGYPLAKAAEDGSLVGRIVNCIALAQDIRSGKLDMLAMADELFDMGADQTMEALLTENYQSIQKQIEGAINVMDTQCLNGKCIDAQKIEGGLTSITETSKFSSEEIKKKLESIRSLPILNNFLKLVIKLLNATIVFEKVIATLDQRQNPGFDSTKFIQDLKNSVRELVDSEEMLLECVRKVNETVLNEQSTIAAFDSFISYGDQLKSLQQKKDAIYSMEEELKKLKNLTKEMRRFLTKGDLEAVTKTINLILQFATKPNSSTEDKALTAGFPRGLEDLQKVPDDLKAPLKDILDNNKSSGKLLDFLKDAITTNEQFKPLLSISDAKSAIYAIEHRIENSLKDLQAAYENISRDELFDQLLDCFNRVDLKTFLDSNNWGSEKNIFASNKDRIKSFETNLKTTKFSKNYFTKTREFNEIIHKTSDVKEILDNIVAFDLTQVKSEISSFKTALESTKHESLNIWVENSQIDSLFNKTEKVVKNADFGPLITCFNTGNILDAFKKVMKEGQLLNSIFKINSKNENFKAFSYAFSAMQKPVSDWSNFKKQRKVRDASSSSTPIILDKPFDVAKKFGMGVKALLDFAVADEVLGAMKTTLNKQSDIDSEITKLKDDEKKRKISKVWNENTRKILKQIVDFVEKMKKSTGKKPTRLADFKEVFEAYGSDALPNFNGRELSHLLSFIQNDKDVEDSLKSLGSLHLEFSSSKKKLLDAGSTLDPLEKFFDGFFGIVRVTSDVTQDGTDNNKENSDKDEGLSTAVIVGLACLGVFIMFAAVVGGYFTVKKIRKTKKAEKEKREKEEKAKASALLRRMQEKAKKDEENAHKKTEPQKKEDVPKKEDKNGNKPGKKEKKSHNPTIAIEEMTEEQFKTNLKTKKPKKIQAKVKVDEEAAVKEFQKKKQEFLAKFKTFHGFDCSALIRKQVVDDSIYTVKFNSDGKQDILAKKYSNAIDLAEEQQVIDNEAFDQNKEKEEYQIPDKLSYEDVKMLMEMRPEKGNWTATTIHHNGVKREYQVSTATDIVKRLKVLIDRRDGDDSTPSLAATQSGTSLSRKPSDMKTACSFKDPNNRVATSGDRREDVEATKTLLSTSADSEVSGDNVDPVDLESQREPNKKPGLFQRLCNRCIAGADDDPFDFGFSKRAFQKDNEEYLITQLRAALSKKFYEVDSCYAFGNKHPITRAMFEPLIELTKGKVSTESAILQLDCKNIRVVGDIHGKYADFVRQVFDILVDETAVGIFLGDYVDRGFRSVDVVYLLCLLKCLFPEKFFFLRGNHETRHINTNYELKVECKVVFKKKGPEMQEKMNQLFDHFPLGAEFHQKIFLSHGGISEHMLEGREVLNEITKTPKTIKQWNLFYDILWCDLVYFYKSDKDKTTSVFTKSKRCPYATVCNQNALKEVMDKMGWLLVIRGHEVKTAGYEYFSERKAITIFGSTQNSNNNMAVQLIVSDAGNLTMYRHECTDDEPDDDDNPTIG